MKQCYICSRVLTELNTNHPKSAICVNCNLTVDQEKEKLKNEIQSSKRHRKRKKT